MKIRHQLRLFQGVTAILVATVGGLGWLQWRDLQWQAAASRSWADPVAALPSAAPDDRGAQLVAMSAELAQTRAELEQLRQQLHRAERGGSGNAVDLVARAAADRAYAKALEPCLIHSLC